MKLTVMQGDYKTLQLLRMVSLLAAFLYIVFGFFVNHVLVIGTEGDFDAGSVAALLLVIPIMNFLFYRWKFLLYANALLLALIVGTFAVSGPTFIEVLLFLISSAAISGVSFRFARRLLSTEETSAAHEQMFQVLFRQSFEGVAVHEMIFDGQNRPVDYVFLKVNPAFEEYTGLRSDEILGKRATEVLPGIEESGFIEKYGAVLRTGDPVQFEQFSEPLQRYYRVSAYSMGGNRFATAFEDISEHRALERERHHLALEYETIFQSTQDAMFLVEVVDNETFRFIRNNDAHAKSTGLDSKGVSGKTPKELVGEELARTITANYRSCVQQRQPLSYEETLALPGGTRTWSTLLTPVVEEGRVTHIVGSSRDITDRKQTEDALREANAVLSSVLDNIPRVMLFLKDAGELKFVRHNLAAEKILGISRRDLYGSTDYDFFPREQADFFVDTDRSVLEQGESVEIPEETIQTAGGERILHTIKAPILNDEGDPIYLLGISEDITERKQTEDALREREAQLKEHKEKLDMILENITDTVWSYDMDQDGNCVSSYISPAGAKQLGISEEELNSSFDIWFSYVLSADLPGVLEVWDESIRNVHGRSYEYRIRRADGAIRWIRSKGDIVHMPDGGLRVVGVGQDITERKQAEDELRESEQRLNTLISQTPAVIYSYRIVDELPQITYVNDNVKHVLGFEPEDFIDDLEFFTECIHPEDSDRVFAMLPKVVTEGRAAQDCRFRDKHGHYRWLHDEQRLITHKDGTREVIGAWWDVTDRKEAEEEYKRYQKRLSQAQRFSQSGMWEYDITSGSLWWSAECERLFGLNAGEFAGTFAAFLDCVYPDDREYVASVNQPITEDEEGNNLEYDHRIIRQDGTIRWVRQSAGVVNEQTGKKVVGFAMDITESKEDAVELESQRSLLEGIIDGMDDVLAIQNPDHTILQYNKAGYQMLNLNPEEVSGKKCYELIGRSQECEECATSIALRTKQLASLEKYMPEMDAFLDCRSNPILDKEGNVTMVVEQIRDISDRKQAEKSLRESEERLQKMLDAIPDLVSIHTPDMDILYSNWNGYGAVSEEKRILQTKCYKTYRGFDHVCPDCQAVQVLQTKEPLKTEAKVLNDTWVDLRVIPLKNEAGEVELFVEWVRDITDRKQAEQEIQYLSFHDGLTGLYNRRFFDEELKRLDVPRNLPLTLMMVDVNGLKLTNDAFGHAVGDRLLRGVADVLRNTVRQDDIIARIGGDEFAILLPNTDEEESHRLKQRLIHRVSGETVEGLPLSVACGRAVKTNSSDDMSDIFEKAEDHMYRDKAAAKSSYRYRTTHLIMQTLYAKSPRERSHAERVSQLCGQIGTAMGLNQTEIDQLITAGKLHDIGKISIDNEILDKNGSLNESDWEQIKRHPRVGHSILSTVNDYGPLADNVLAHHERWDGAGYPNGRKGTEIPRMARIIAVADAYDAMTSDRPYRRAMSHEDAVEEMEACAGSQFDPEVVEVFVGMM